MPKVEANQSKGQEVIAEKQGLTGSEIHSSFQNRLVNCYHAVRLNLSNSFSPPPRHPHLGASNDAGGPADWLAGGDSAHVTWHRANSPCDVTTGRGAAPREGMASKRKTGRRGVRVKLWS